MIDSKEIDEFLAQKDAARKKQLELEYEALDKVLASDELQNIVSGVLDLTIKTVLDNLNGKPFIMFSTDIDKEAIFKWVLAKDHATFSKYEDDINKRINKLIVKNMHKRGLTQKSVQLDSDYGPNRDYKIWITKEHKLGMCFWPSCLFLIILLLLIFYMFFGSRFVSRHSAVMMLIAVLIPILMIVDFVWFAGEYANLEVQAQRILDDKYAMQNKY